jgi:hypothetical protein
MFFSDFHGGNHNYVCSYAFVLSIMVTAPDVFPSLVELDNQLVFARLSGSCILSGQHTAISLEVNQLLMNGSRG